MPKNKPQNLEELVDKISRRTGFEFADVADIADVVVKATLDAVRVGKIRQKRYGKYELPMEGAYEAVEGHNEAVAKYQRKAEDWLGEGGKG